MILNVIVRLCRRNRVLRDTNSMLHQLYATNSLSLVLFLDISICPLSFSAIAPAISSSHPCWFRSEYPWCLYNAPEALTCPDPHHRHKPTSAHNPSTRYPLLSTRPVRPSTRTPGYLIETPIGASGTYVMQAHSPWCNIEKRPRFSETSTDHKHCTKSFVHT
jgi:hypothetical protein